MHGKVETFDSYDELIAMGSAVSQDMLAEKVCCFDFRIFQYFSLSYSGLHLAADRPSTWRSLLPCGHYADPQSSLPA
jgi:hypothetical protein